MILYPNGPLDNTLKGRCLRRRSTQRYQRLYRRWVLALTKHCTASRSPLDMLLLRARCPRQTFSILRLVVEQQEGFRLRRRNLGSWPLKSKEHWTHVETSLPKMLKLRPYRHAKAFILFEPWPCFSLHIVVPLIFASSPEAAITLTLFHGHSITACCNEIDLTQSSVPQRVHFLQVDPTVSFDQVGGLEQYVKALKEMVFLPLVYPELFERFHITPPRGVLFYGPPGIPQSSTPAVPFLLVHSNNLS